MAKIIRLGDPTSHGGKVIGSQVAAFKSGGSPMAVVGDTVSCPLPGHQGCVIATGHAKHKIKGLAVAYEGDKTSCGADLISTRPSFSRT